MPQWKPDTEFHDTGKANGIDFPSTVRSSKFSQHKDIEGMDPLQIPLWKFLYQGLQQYLATTHCSWTRSLHPALRQHRDDRLHRRVGATTQVEKPRFRQISTLPMQTTKRLSPAEWGDPTHGERGRPDHAILASCSIRTGPFEPTAHSRSGSPTRHIEEPTDQRSFYSRFGTHRLGHRSHFPGSTWSTSSSVDFLSAIHTDHEGLSPAMVFKPIWSRPSRKPHTRSGSQVFSCLNPRRMSWKRIWKRPWNGGTNNPKAQMIRSKESLLALAFIQPNSPNTRTSNSWPRWVTVALTCAEWLSQFIRTNC